MSTSRFRKASLGPGPDLFGQSWDCNPSHDANNGYCTSPTPHSTDLAAPFENESCSDSEEQYEGFEYEYYSPLSRHHHGNDQWDVEKLVAHRISDKKPGQSRDVMMYLLKWEGPPFPEGNYTWKPRNELTTCKDYLKAYHAQHPQSKSIPAMRRWLESSFVYMF